MAGIGLPLSPLQHSRLRFLLNDEMRQAAAKKRGHQWISSARRVIWSRSAMQGQRMSSSTPISA